MELAATVWWIVAKWGSKIEGAVSSKLCIKENERPPSSFSWFSFAWQAYWLELTRASQHAHLYTICTDLVYPILSLFPFPLTSEYIFDYLRVNLKSQRFYKHYILRVNIIHCCRIKKSFN